MNSCLGVGPIPLKLRNLELKFGEPAQGERSDKSNFARRRVGFGIKGEGSIADFETRAIYMNSFEQGYEN